MDGKGVWISGVHPRTRRDSVEMEIDLLQVVNLTKENPAPHHPHRNLIEDCQICSKSSMNHTPQEGNKLSD
ncbi:hypothetical protein RHGRI_005942 [Rhododendron griersonianum]|uniref:Uncharacterized protein n=1 Tax=Rhododendron griersonianum TaxID=479676 RepID=A0AAV6LEH9_9ERIC|nr:hypothetical protein RHGRI_005942 [Rhododendron griersonianum]